MHPSNKTLKTVAIIPAAGSGVRMGNDRPKQFLDLDNRPLLAATLQPFQKCRAVDAVFLVVPSKDMEYCQKEIVEKFKLDKVRKIVPGGDRRQDSVRLGLAATNADYDLVLIHDGVRPVISESIIELVIDEARTNRAVITGLPARETVKMVGENREVVSTYERKQVWLIQTPQAFRYKDILAAHEKAMQDSREEATDDSVLVEKLGIPVKVVQGSEKNIKVTTPNDLELARFLLGET
ncbi:MAG: 2-C-methyl-D-erythritol 4-phosphate cytidylyltransferase [Desulfobacterales bacterium]|nr:2-C-methyl-D-erythritol 4-phosphate cytidylyltransferase [Desulfobacterales bacterium]